MSKSIQIEEIVNFVAKHPESLVSRRICRETLGTAVDQVNADFATKLAGILQEKDSAKIDAYYTLIR